MNKYLLTLTLLFPLESVLNAVSYPFVSQDITPYTWTNRAIQNMGQDAEDSYVPIASNELKHCLDYLYHESYNQNTTVLFKELVKNTMEQSIKIRQYRYSLKKTLSTTAEVRSISQEVVRFIALTFLEIMDQFQSMGKSASNGGFDYGLTEEFMIDEGVEIIIHALYPRVSSALNKSTISKETRLAIYEDMRHAQPLYPAHPEATEKEVQRLKGLEIVATFILDKIVEEFFTIVQK